ncbi:Transcription elongation factor SPT5 [Fusarium euwallaceae]|uniref:Transcription elongation factor SPT5 n=3 Tax=Fusarium solani species complex TaxID=232080 RepID=A0A430LG88_9HYPO|nr:Transcription elongation factor SPT5 [Fusarium floridanum]RSM12774.1 Transcription elongation factor SPT5 [Fusarium ambrosium]RTE74742.1 Transcription elongation factor SPT5 [Fusarium euwallaceae]
MSSHDPSRFDDSEDEEDFNPAPADISDDEQDGDDQQSRSRARDSSPAHRDDDDDEDERPARSRHVDDDEEEEEEEEEDDGGRRRDDDDEEDEEEDEEDEDVQQGHRRKRRKERGANFFDIEAEVDDEDEGEDDEVLGEEIGDFIANEHPDDMPGSAGINDDRRHRELDRRRDMESSMDAEKQAEILRQRYGNRRSGKGFRDATIVPKRLLLPSVDDPSIWAVRCKEGKEREVVFSIMKRIEERAGTKDELAITAAFERGGTESVMKGFIYVEALRQTDIMRALDNMLNVYPHSKMVLVEIKDMPELFRVQKTPTLAPGAWVRLKRPMKHSGDLAQVIDVTENGLEARVRFIPRLDYGMRDDAFTGVTADGKRKRPFGASAGPRPPQRLFSEIEARKRHPRHIQGNPTTNTWQYMGDEFENGFQVKDIKIQQLTVAGVEPSLEEVTRFASNAEDGTENLDLKALAASLKDSGARATYLPGDIVEVYTGEQKGVVGKAMRVQTDVVSITVTEGDLRGQEIDVPIRALRKRFRVGDHVKVIGGSKFRDEVGMVVKIQDDRVTLLSDQTNAEITVFSKDLREASDIGGQGSLGQYSLHDLVQLDPTTVGCVVKVDRESLVVLDQFGDNRQVMPSQIANKLPKRKNAVAADRNGSEIRFEDVVKEFTGQQRQGKIIHIHRSYVFLHTNDSKENAGVFVTKASMVNTIAAKGGRVSGGSSGPDLNAMNPALKLHKNGNENKPVQPVKSFGRDKAIDQTVIIKKGAYKGLLGIVKDTTDTHARVELHTKSKTITVPKDCLSFKNKMTGATIEIGGRGRGGYSGGAGRGGGDRVPGWQGGSRTPMASGGSDRVPAWGSRTPAAGGRTPAWKAPDMSGARTPAWADGSRTVNPYDGNRTAYGSGSRTPAWQAGGRTPAPGDAFGAGSRTPAYGGGDSWGSGSKTPAWGVSAPTPGASGNDSWGYTPGASGSGYDAPTPGGPLGAPTPGAMNAPTPGAYSAPTPAVNAPTPGGWQGGWGADSAPTPAAGAPTPAASGYYGAPTPAAYGAPETPAASGPRYTDDD